jgi:phosphoglycolate phosphatase
MTKKYKNILFDLDGTLTDSKEGIFKSLDYALKSLGMETPPMEDLYWVMGPPLSSSFAKLLNTEDAEEIQKAVDIYRERFGKIGMYENELFDGIEDVLEKLKNRGYKLFLATSKPIIFATEITRYFDIQKYFDALYGAELSDVRVDKTELIKYVIEKESLDKKETIMIGDRVHDIVGANNNGIDSVAVLYGYGSKKELSEGNPTYFVKSPKELEMIFKK